MSDLEDLANVVKNRRSVPYARPVVIQEPRAHGGGYYLAGMALVLWTCLCVGLAGWVVYAAATDQSPPTMGELGVRGLASGWSAGSQGPVINDYVREQRLRGALVTVGGIGIAWAVLTVPMALVMIACKK